MTCVSISPTCFVGLLVTYYLTITSPITTHIHIYPSQYGLGGHYRTCSYGEVHKNQDQDCEVRDLIHVLGHEPQIHCCVGCTIQYSGKERSLELTVILRVDHQRRAEVPLVYQWTRVQSFNCLLKDKIAANDFFNLFNISFPALSSQSIHRHNTNW